MVDVRAIAKELDPDLLRQVELIAILERADHEWVRAAKDWMDAEIRRGGDPEDILRVLVFLSGALCGAAFRSMNATEPFLIYDTIGRHFVAIARYVAVRKAAP